MENRALEDVTIVAASLAESGPVATQILAFLGAKVIKIERPNTRSAKNRDLQETIAIRNCNKKTITLNTKTPEGKEIMWRLLEKADVFLENFAPGAWERMGFSYEEVRKRNPEIIYVTVKGFAKKSRWSQCITYDPVACTTGGSTYLSGMEDMAPMLCGINVADSGSGIHFATAIMAAILEKKLTGHGQYIECPMQNAVIASCRRAFPEYYATGEVRRAGNSFKGLRPTAPHNLYPTQGTDPYGNYICICCSPDEDSPDFENLCRAIRREDLLDDPRFQTPALRYENRFALDHEIRKWTLLQCKEEAVKVLAKEYGVPAGPVLSIDEISRDAFLSRAGGVLQHLRDDPLIEDMLVPTIPIHMSGSAWTRVTSCGLEGAGNDDVFGEMLNISRERREELHVSGVI